MPITARLRDGARLEIEIAEPPFDSSYDSLRLCWWPMIRDDLLRGRMNRWLYAPHFIGRIDGNPAGSMCCYAPRDSGAVGAVEFVGTEQRFRRRGVASALLGTLVEHFTARGGKALYLCTDNPVAGHLYERHGFRYHVGDGMRYLAPGAADFDRRWFAPGGATTTRDAHWGDLARMCVLYNHPDPAWLVKDPLSAAFRDTRYERHFVSVLRQIEDGGGAFLVLEADASRVVGAAAFRRRDTFYEQHVATLSLRVARGLLRSGGRPSGDGRRARRGPRHPPIGAAARGRGRRTAAAGGGGRLRGGPALAAAAARRGGPLRRPRLHAAGTGPAHFPRPAPRVVLRRTPPLAGRPRGVRRGPLSRLRHRVSRSS